MVNNKPARQERNPQMHETEWGALVLAIAIAIALYAYGKGYKHGKQEAANGRR